MRPGFGGVAPRGGALPTLCVPPPRKQPGIFRRAAQGADFRVVYPIEAFFLPGGLVLVGRYAEAGVTLAAMLGGLWLARRVTRFDRP